MLTLLYYFKVVPSKRSSYNSNIHVTTIHIYNALLAENDKSILTARNNQHGQISSSKQTCHPRYAFNKEPRYLQLAQLE